MRLADLPSTTIRDGKRPRLVRAEAPPVVLTREQELEQEVEALRSLLKQAREVFRESTGCIVRMVNVRQSANAAEALRRTREHGRAFLIEAGVHAWDRPTGPAPVNHTTPWRRP